MYSHLHDPEKTVASGEITRGESYLLLSPERVAMQDASAQCVKSLLSAVYLLKLKLGWPCQRHHLLYPTLS
jgi:hypothetical protein